MSEIEDFDELPSITVNSLTNNSNSFVMPPAQVLASQRAREEACERELRELRSHDARASDVTALAHSDSSSSEGEAALAGAVRALQVAAPRPAPPPRSAAALAAVRPLLPAAYRPLAAPGADLSLAVSAVAALLAAETEWSDEAALGAGALLSAALLGDARDKREATRAMHALLDDRATDAQVCMVSRACLSAFPCARRRLRLSDAVRSGARAGADRLAAALLWAALGDALQVPPEAWGGSADAARLGGAVAARWRQLESSARYTVLQGAGRVLSAGGDAGGARPALLAALAADKPASTPHAPQDLKVLVAASKLRLLFRPET